MMRFLICVPLQQKIQQQSPARDSSPAHFRKIGVACRDFSARMNIISHELTLSLEKASALREGSKFRKIGASVC